MHDGDTAQIRLIEDAEDNGIRFVRLCYHGGEMNAEDFLSYVRAGEIEPKDNHADEAYQFALCTANSGGERVQSDGTEREKIERARELLQEAHDELCYSDNSLLGPAIDQIDAHERQHWSVNARGERDEE